MELSLVHYDSNRPGPHLLITGGVHGDEFAPMAAIRDLIVLFGREHSPLTRGSLTLVPVVNEAAFHRGHRMAEDSLDLARVCPGKVDGTITERTAHALSQLIHKADNYIDLHTGGTEYSVWPLAGYTLHPDPVIRKRQRAMAEAFNLPVVWGTAGNLDGRSLSVARDAGVPAIYTEYLGAGRLDLEGTEAYVDGCLNVMSFLGMVDRTMPLPAVRHVVEDPRPGSGHMQVCNPSPMTGLFKPLVKLGDPISAGQPIGVVTDLLGRESREVCSEQNGIMLVLRSFPRVMRDQSVGVVLELEV